MNTQWISRLVFGGLLLATVPAFAQNAVYEEETVYTFDPDEIRAELNRPYGDQLFGQHHGKQSSIFTIRADFIAEMERSVEDL